MCACVQGVSMCIHTHSLQEECKCLKDKDALMNDELITVKPKDSLGPFSL